MCQPVWAHLSSAGTLDVKIQTRVKSRRKKRATLHLRKFNKWDWVCKRKIQIQVNCCTLNTHLTLLPDILPCWYVCLSPDSNDLSWESSSWVRQQQEVSEHLCKSGLWQDSICRRFTLDEKNVLLQWSNLQPTRWTPLRTADALSPVLCPGYYHVTILGEVTQWWHPKLKKILFAVPATSTSVEYRLISCIILFFSFFF